MNVIHLIVRCALIAFDRCGAAAGRRRVSLVMVVATLCFGAGWDLAQRSTPVQLLHPSGADADRFGIAVAIDGDTMLVGASDADVGGNAEQGTVHVYRWTGSGWTFEAQLTASGGSTGGYFGYSVALSGDTAIVGAFGDVGGRGSASVFTRSGTTWTHQAQLAADDGQPGDVFGSSVAISGDTAIVGAPRDDVGANTDQGSAYVFVRSGMTWTQQARFTAADGAAGDIFGSSVAVSGDTAIVGAPADDVGANPDRGSAYVFTRTGATWTQQAQLTASDGAAADWFGYSVALSGDTAVVGAHFDDVGGIVNRGSAYVFVRSGVTWSQQAQFIAPDSASGLFFGYSVALSGDTAVVGASSMGIVNQGSAFVFTRSGTTWTQQALLTATDGASGDGFGSSVALSGDTAVAGAPYDDVGANFDQGSAWVFSRVGSTWIGPDLKLLASDGAALDVFGYSAAVSGDTAIVGARTDDVGASVDQGSAYVFTRSGTTWTQQAQLTATGGAAGDQFGYSVALSGDTAIVGAWTDDVGANGNQGSAYIFTRSGSTWTQQAQLTATGGVGGDQFGVSVALSGDTAIVGAFNDDVGASTDQGSAFVFVRSGTTWTQQAQLIAAGGAAGDNFGVGVALSGDTAIVGAFSDDVGANGDQGSAFVFTRSGTTWTQQAQLTSTGGAAGDRFGYSVALSGDTAITGAFNNDVGANPNQGAAYVFVRTGITWTQQAQLTASDGAAGDQFGGGVALSGDTAIVGAYADDMGNNTDQGSAYVFVRSGTSWTQQTQLTAADGAAGDSFGGCVALSGDTTVIGAFADNVGANADQGSVWAFIIPAEDLSLAHNDVTDISYPTLAAAVFPAVGGQQITASEAAWRTLSSLSTQGRSLALLGSGDIRTAPGSIVTLTDSTLLAAPSGSPIEIFGELRAQGFIDLYADAFRLGLRGALTARTGSSLLVAAPTASLEGTSRVEQGASVRFTGAVTAIGPVTTFANASVDAGGTILNDDVWTMTSGQVTAPLFDNRAQAIIFGSSAVFGSYTNEAGAVTTIRSGTLFVFGSLTNEGTIVGTVCSNCLGGPPNLDVGGSLVLGPAANLLMPFTGSLVHLGGSFDCAINDNTRYDMNQATLQLEGTGPEQTLEVMSADIGPDESGLDRTLSGRYPVGTLHIGPGVSTVRLVDAHDNDGLGQDSCEAIYVDTLRIEEGSRLMNPSCRIYYRTLENSGTVDALENLIPIGTPCFADFNQDGGIDGADVQAFFAAWEAGDFAADVNQDGGVDGADVDTFFAAWEAGGC
ncbi:MAG: hypothetical protein JSR77_05995 [Planctomycetes bacterium]|nr:hypothetical protein [Planctomycetota bacterium]